MPFVSFVKALRAGQSVQFPLEAKSLEYARGLDAEDDLGHLRDQFLIPTRGSLKKKALNGTLLGKGPNGATTNQDQDDNTPSIYFVGNSLGAQPKAVRSYLEAHLETWASVGVNGHFTQYDNSPLVSWQDMAEDCATKSAAIVGASPGEIVIMNSLTANLHLMMASFYRPTEKRHKIILEWKPFPSDWYAIQSQITLHGFSPATSMVEVQPDPSPNNFYISTATILSTIDAHADSAALLLLPGIQYYTGQLFDMPLITRYAQDRGIVVGWDLAHAAGNVELALHDWNVDFAVWCTYKYLNAGPGAIAGAFVHERHGKVGRDGSGKAEFRPRLSGWYGADKSVRFNMEKEFQPTAGAGGFQLSNPSAVDLASLSAALGVFGMTSMARLRDKALVLTAYAEWLLDGVLAGDGNGGDGGPPFRIITPRSPLERGTQLSILFGEGLLERVSKRLVENGVVFDVRKPDVIRIAPVPMYCTFVDVWKFGDIFKEAMNSK
ncbi:pyridoxal phosphate-dependent transferase [Bombardia bombarda]|uniref:Kynureninase n=1 Tax=Bombardia bombarda TaxID=252184 RepID=A0AA39XNV9_9PEZI|nr:pyridoxal phosphate-dependent transferase [Bombardia bombarda]